MSFRATLLTLAFALISSVTLPPTSAFATPDDNKKTGVELFLHSDDVMKDVESTLARAKESHKLALIVLGADWCHDSRGLVSHFNDPAMKNLLAENYELTLVDVEFFEHGLDVVHRFGQPTIIATPTVLIIDPTSEKLVNSHNMHQFKEAAAMSLEDTISYFDAMRLAANQIPPITSNGDVMLDKLLTEIDAFEATQAARIEVGFQQMVPFLKMPKEESPKEFHDLWMELRGLRYAITGDMAALRKQALERTEAGQIDITLTYPNYKSFSWE
mgnify:CR=1 FL=1|jgi:hypothetical protein